MDNDNDFRYNPFGRSDNLPEEEFTNVTATFPELTAAMFSGKPMDLGLNGGPVYIMVIERESGYNKNMTGANIHVMFHTGFTEKTYVRFIP